MAAATVATATDGVLPHVDTTMEVKVEVDMENGVEKGTATDADLLPRRATKKGEAATMAAVRPSLLAAIANARTHLCRIEGT